MSNLSCNCYHSKEDHHFRANDHIIGDRFYMWCKYSEIGQCPCDVYTSMTNLDFLEWKYEQQQ